MGTPKPTLPPGQEGVLQVGGRAGRRTGGAAPLSVGWRVPRPGPQLGAARGQRSALSSGVTAAWTADDSRVAKLDQEAPMFSGGFGPCRPSDPAPAPPSHSQSPVWPHGPVLPRPTELLQDGPGELRWQWLGRRGVAWHALTWSRALTCLARRGQGREPPPPRRTLLPACPAAGEMSSRAPG